MGGSAYPTGNKRGQDSSSYLLTEEEVAKVNETGGGMSSRYLWNIHGTAYMDEETGYGRQANEHTKSSKTKRHMPFARHYPWQSRHVRPFRNPTFFFSTGLNHSKAHGR